MVELSEAKRLIEVGDLKRAYGILASFLDQNEENASALHLLGVVHAELGRYTEAVDYIMKAQSILPLKADYFYSLANVMLKKNWYDQAEVALKRSIELDPNNADYFELLADLSIRKNDKDTAIASLRRSVDLLNGGSDKRENLPHLNTPLVLRDNIYFDDLRPSGSFRNFEFRGQSADLDYRIHIQVYPSHVEKQALADTSALLTEVSYQGEGEKVHQGVITKELLMESLSDEYKAFLGLTEDESFRYYLYEI